MGRIHRSRVVAFAATWPGKWEPVAYSEEVVDESAERWAIARKEDGAEVFLSTVWGGSGKLRFSGTFPRDSQGNSYLPFGKHYKDFSCNVSASRPTGTISREVSRRLLSVYLPAYADACQRKQNDKDYKARQEALAQHLADLLSPIGATGGYRQGDSVVVDIPRLGELSPNGDSKVDVKLRGLSMAQAEAICRVLVDLAQEDPEEAHP